MIIFVVTMPFSDLYMLIDDIIWGKEYRKVSLDNAVFLVGGFRTGSTSLHRALALDKERFVSPRFIEVAFPFLWLNYFFDWLERRDKVKGTTTIKNIENKLQEAIGKENMARHPMSWYEAEEDDIVLATWHYSGWYVGALFPDPECLMISGQQNLQSEHAQKKSFEFYKRCMQKFMYRRGNGRALLSKNHMINFLPILAKELPNAKFVDIVRHPKDAFISWYALSQGSLSVLARQPVEKKTMVEAHLRFWDKFTQAERDFFIKEAGYGTASQNRTMITFNEYIKDQEKIARSLYKQWGYPVEGTKFEERLVADRENHKNYKKNTGYQNPTLEDLGLDRETMSKRYADYIKECKI